MIEKIGFTGVHGSGKTTRAKELRDQYRDLGKKVYVVDEVARSCPLTLRTVEAQEWIWYAQITAEKRAMEQDVDVIICDRTIMDNLMYYREVIESMYGLEGYSALMRWWDLYREAEAWMAHYTQVIRLPLNLEWLQAEDPIRPKDELYARRIDALFDRFVAQYVTA